jgi:penicillin-binding protein 2
MKQGTSEPLRDPRAALVLFHARALQVLLVVLLVLVALVARFFWLQVVDHESYLTRSEDNRLRVQPIAPSRGLIYDREGRILADNVPAYRLELVPERVADLGATIAALREVLPIADDDVARFYELRSARRRFHSIPLKFRLSESEVAAFAVRRHLFPGVDVVPYLTRFYPRGPSFAHVVGYVGRIDARDRERIDLGRYAATSHIGKTGIERFYEDLLHGEVGFERVETNAEGRVLSVVERQAPRPGRHLYLSLDIELQEIAEEAFAGRNGAAVAIDPRNGEVLLLLSMPGFDPNAFVNGIGRSDYAALLASAHRPLFNRALQGGYEPGSTLKPFLGLAGLDLGVRGADDTVLSVGEYRLPGQQQGYRDWRRGGHGRVSLKESIAQSVNTYFYSLAADMGIDRMGEYMARFGFGAPVGIDLQGEGSGVLPSRQWKRAHLNQPWYPGETVIAGIGQGFWVTSPLQLATATAILAAGGERAPIHLLRATQEGFNEPWLEVRYASAENVLQSSPGHWQLIRDGMVAVMHGPTGTARAVGADSPYRIAGKTGTAQRVRRGEGEYDEDTVPEHLRHQALFIAFAPAEAPRIAVAVVVEAGSSGSRTAAPVARRIMDAWLSRQGEDWTSRPSAPLASGTEAH